MHSLIGERKEIEERKKESSEDRRKKEKRSQDRNM